MRWYTIFIKGLKEQVREYWILVLTVAMAPIFIAVYYRFMRWSWSTWTRERITWMAR